MKKQTIVLAVLVFAALSLGVYASFFRSAGVMVADNSNFGATAGPTKTDPCFSYGGAQFCALSVPILATSSSICVFPAMSAIGAGSSTLVSFTADIATSSATGIGIAAQTFDLSTTTAVGAYGSSTPAFIKEAQLAAQTQGQIIYAPAATTSTSRLIGVDSFRGNLVGGVIAPNVQLTFRVASGTPGTFSTYYGGTCKALFQVTRGF